MKNFFAFIFFSLCVTQLYAQTSGEKIYSATTLHKGFYKDYSEYINNSPSITDSFIVYAAARADKDSTIQVYDYYLADSSKTLRHIWGFCDGSGVYIKRPRGLDHPQYWRIEYLGKYSFVTFYDKTNYIFLGPTLLFTAASAAAATFDAAKAVQLLYIIMPDGKLENATNLHFMRNFFKPQPAILQDYEALKNKFDKAKLKVLIKRFSEAG